MKAFGTFLLVAAVVSAAVGAYNVNPTEGTVESVYLDELAKQRREFGQPLSEFVGRFKNGYEESRDKRLLARNVAFAVAALCFVSGIICIAAQPTHRITADGTRSGTVLEADAIRSKLEKLSELREANLISQQEFESQRATLLNDFVKH